MEVNDFNAVRISLASPEQIKSWSYGEVTKPETINYRTLKPEKDGLFCEKIFGPTKDFECYCGKYKRVRYKGIVCDKCGVEVARSKVRRERMGHIELASPVAHIWFVKGTPSRLGLLLDISPRNLERILYFAEYAVSFVDNAAKERAQVTLQEEIEAERERRAAELDEQINAVEKGREEGLAQVESEHEANLKKADAEYDKRVEALNKAAAAVQADLKKQMGKTARKDFVLEGHVIVKKGATIEPEAADKLGDPTQELLAGYEADRERARDDARILLESARDQKNADFDGQLLPLAEKKNAISEEVETEYEELTAALDDLKDPIEADTVALLKENRYRDLSDRFTDVFRAGMGAEALVEILERVDLEALREKLLGEIQSSSGQRRKKATKRLRVVEALRKSGNKPQWMIFTVLPVLPPDLRPMVQLDGGRFATSDLNDLYRRVINRNNRLKRLLELGAPEIIIRNEKRMLQEAVDSLIDNGRRGRAVSGQGNHKLKSLSDMLKGKQGRFRQNLLGKRVDYSGRSVIVVGPELELHQCGLPKRMALELFKPFVMHALVAQGHAHNIKSAKRYVERARPEVWDILDEVIKKRPVLLNRAPTLHRLGIQAFEPVLIEGSAIQVHPLVCSAFNADFDGDQMAVHVPLSSKAVAEARLVMLSTKNQLLPSSGEPTVAPTLDIVLGCYYLTMSRPGSRGEYDGKMPPRGVYSSFGEARLAYSIGTLDLQANVKVRDARTDNELIDTTVGRIIFDEIVPPELEFYNSLLDRKALKSVVEDCYRKAGPEVTAKFVNDLKNLGFRYATQSGLSIAVNDIQVPGEKQGIIDEATRRVSEIEDNFEMGLITEDERYQETVDVWHEATDLVEASMRENLDEYGSVNIMSSSGAKGNISQIRQMAGMRGLMSDPTGKIIELPIKSSFREGLTVLEYFISTHGARKGLADTALRTADSGYLTRRLIDVAQDMIVLEEDCQTELGSWISTPSDPGLIETLAERIKGRYAAAPVAHPETGEVLVDRGDEITDEAAAAIEEAGIERVYARSPLVCMTPRGICRYCYGRDLSRGELVRPMEAVGIIAAESIGEPGTQLTMRTFHTGGVASVKDITSGLPRVEELFEARVPKGMAIISEIAGRVEILREGDLRRVKVISSEVLEDEIVIPKGAEMLVKKGDVVEDGAVIARIPSTNGAKKRKTKAETAVAAAGNEITARIGGRVEIRRGKVSVFHEDRDEREYPLKAADRLLVDQNDIVEAGQALTDGAINPQDMLRVRGRDAAQRYLVEEVQKVYRNQGVTINDKHIEVIIRQMLRRVMVDATGDTPYLPGELVDEFVYNRQNEDVLAQGGEPATAKTVLLGVTKASLHTDSFLAAASFQETTRVLTEASIGGRTDTLQGLKENVIIGKLIPARALENFDEELQMKVAGVKPKPLLIGADGDGVDGERAWDVEDMEELEDFDEVPGDIDEGFEKDLEDYATQPEDEEEATWLPSAYVAEPDDDEDDLAVAEEPEIESSQLLDQQEVAADEL
ncbi:MAG TPA: DNA-directed RNA polymerase subunit beta', partial [Dehalococcoidia bacterium]|nr:DNA-directed RNA polymerase subunit beta' [Dehalococcoidia bacterium]